MNKRTNERTNEPTNQTNERTKQRTRTIGGVRANPLGPGPAWGLWWCFSAPATDAFAAAVAVAVVANSNDDTVSLNMLLFAAAAPPSAAGAVVAGRKMTLLSLPFLLSTFYEKKTKSPAGVRRRSEPGRRSKFVG